jgi:transposase
MDMIKDDMQMKREQRQTRMMLLPPLEAFIPKDHPIRRLNKVLDLSFVHDAVREHYCHDNGRPSIDPEVIIRLFLLQAIEGIPHVRDLMRQVAVNLAYRWFIGYDLDEPLPDHSTLSRALDRFGDEVFNELFTRSIAQCKSKGLIEGRVLHLDATTIRADLDENRVNKDDSSDPDARFGRFPDGCKHPGYKQQTVVDNKAKVILDVSVVPANEAEGSSAIESIERAVERTGSKPDAVCADSAYASGENAAGFEQRDIRLISPPPKPVNGRGGEGFFTIEEFRYNEEKNEFICPAGQRLKQAGRMAGEPHRRKYRASVKSCRGCSLKDKCTRSDIRCLNVSIYHGAMVRLRIASKTGGFRELYASRAPSIEGVFAEAKCWHGLRRAWRRGLAKMRVQSLLIAAVINLKRLIAFFMLIIMTVKAQIGLIFVYRKNAESIFSKNIDLSKAVYQ